MVEVTRSKEKVTRNCSTFVSYVCESTRRKKETSLVFLVAPPSFTPEWSWPTMQASPPTIYQTREPESPLAEKGSMDM